MNIVFRSRYSIDQAFLVAQWAILLATILSFSLFSIFLFRTRKFERVSLVNKPLQILDLEKIISGPLKLKENPRSPFALTLEQKLTLLAQSRRPGSSQKEKVFCIGIKGSDKQKVVKSGEAIYLKLEEHSTGAIENLEFTETQSDIRLIPHVLNGDSLILNLEKSDEKTELFVKESPHALSLPKEKGLLDLYKAKLWGNDLFFREYGGNEYCHLGQKNKIELGEGNNRYILFVQQNEFLTLREGKWHLTSLDEAAEDAPLAQVKMGSSNQMEIEAWDEEGFPLFHRKIETEKKEPFQVNPDQLITTPKLRSAKQVSCKIGKKQMFLKPGDWLIKTQTSWHKINGLNEIEAFLNQEIRGDLFVIDNIESSGKLLGRYFNPMRTQMRSFAVQAASSKEKHSKKRGGTHKK